jgi:hypothetical protein
LINKLINFIYTTKCNTLKKDKIIIREDYDD